jgi:hypothetical protein
MGSKMTKKFGVISGVSNTRVDLSAYILVINNV